MAERKDHGHPLVDLADGGHDQDREEVWAGNSRRRPVGIQCHKALITIARSAKRAAAPNPYATERTTLNALL